MTAGGGVPLPASASVNLEVEELYLTVWHEPAKVPNSPVGAQTPSAADRLLPTSELENKTFV